MLIYLKTIIFSNNFYQLNISNWPGRIKSELEMKFWLAEFRIFFNLFEVILFFYCKKKRVRNYFFTFFMSVMLAKLNDAISLPSSSPSYLAYSSQFTFSP